MGMPITVEVPDFFDPKNAIEKFFLYFSEVDGRFSTYKETSEITRMNKNRLQRAGYSEDMKTVLALCEETKKQTDGYFDIVTADGRYDPSGLVKGWSIYNAAQLLLKEGFKNFYIDAGGDIQTGGNNKEGKRWSVGIKNPFNQKEIVKVLYIKDEGVATSGTYIRGQHIYNPKKRSESITEIVSLTVVGQNIYEADRFATAAFAMGKPGIAFIEKLKGFEGYMIDKEGIATMTSGIEKYTFSNS